ncbi:MULTISPECIES: TadE/TadG family type IV pilus assembly protein [unclassified Ensifer]|uniref:TadE/TadG family type IV pilus assembly protein n=1 Tax=unclassified Ensifer TaxID=2633371 RepID=UPI0009F3738B|nr:MULTISPECIES: TadE/TadG family type IV pilus assembly protein [unclassified Ensifer]
MGKRSTINRSFMAMLKDRGGNFGMMAALVMPLVLAAGGVAIDMAKMVTTKNQMQDAADAAALAAASALVSKEKPDIAKAKEIATNFLKAQTAGGNSVDLPANDDGATASGFAASANAAPIEELEVNSSTVDIIESANGATGKAFKVTVANKQTLQFNAMTRLLGQKSILIETRATAESATETKNALSMYLVLDRSGSMAWKSNTQNTAKSSCPNYTESNWGKYPNLAATSPCYVTKIDALKTAVKDLLAQLKAADPKDLYVRTAAVSYNSAQDTAGNIAWGTAGTGTYVNALVATGGTASGNAFKTAYSRVTATTEDTAHKTKNGQVATKYIVFMTDGANNNTSDDTTTLQWCDTARKNNVQVYTVAFMAPDRGKALLKSCATTVANYFQAEEAADLIAAFKAIGEKASAMATRLTK